MTSKLTGHWIRVFETLEVKFEDGRYFYKGGELLGEDCASYDPIVCELTGDVVPLSVQSAIAAHVEATSGL